MNGIHRMVQEGELLGPTSGSVSESGIAHPVLSPASDGPNGILEKHDKRRSFIFAEEFGSL